VAPDYPGLGTDGLHGYLVSRQEGRAALDALRATRSFARFQELPISDEYAMVGLSQGGHATLAAAAAHEQYAPELDIRAFAAAAPASGWSEHWRQGVNVQGSHQAYHALLVYSWAQHYGWSGPALWDSGFAADVEDVMTNHCIFDPASGSNTLAPEVSNDPAQVFSEAFFEAYSSGDWGEFAQFGNWFAENRIGPYGQTAPLRIYQGSDDPVVLEDHTRQMVQALRDGGVEVDYKVVSGGRHTDVAFGFVAQDQRRTEESIAWVQSHL
jgi:pimeloyl-ACP methyl ester carboxylesterase